MGGKELFEEGGGGGLVVVSWLEDGFGIESSNVV